MSKASIFLPALFILACPASSGAETVTPIRTDRFVQMLPSGTERQSLDRLRVIDRHKNAHVYLPIWDIRSLKMSVPWDAGYDMPAKPKTLSLMASSGDVYWQSHLRPEPANLASSRLAVVSLPASIFFTFFALFSLWLAAASRQTKAVRRQYN